MDPDPRLNSAGEVSGSLRPLDVPALRCDFPIFNLPDQDPPLIYLDNAATTQKPDCVLKALMRFYSEYNANVHRAIYRIGEQATEAFEAVRDQVTGFINAPDRRAIVFTRGTTEAINLVAHSWARRQLKSGDEILITELEHHSNLVPWQMVAGETGAVLKYIPVTRSGVLADEDSGRYFSSRTKLFACTQVSNALGTAPPLQELLAAARNAGAVTLVDAAQSVPHQPVDVQQLDCDFLAFSGHKMLAPAGAGILYGRPELLEEMAPYQGGGDMINTVTMTQSTWNDIPWKFEAGTPDIGAVIGLGAALEYLENTGMDRIHSHTREITAYALQVLSAIPQVTLYGPRANRGPVISFNVRDIHPHDLAQFLDQDGIAIRVGHHCAQPLMDKLQVSATARASFYLYNTKSEVDALGAGILRTIRFLGS